jgi:hypothetical protein
VPLVYSVSLRGNWVTPPADALLDADADGEDADVVGVVVVVDELLLQALAVPSASTPRAATP